MRDVECQLMLWLMPPAGPHAEIAAGCGWERDRESLCTGTACVYVAPKGTADPVFQCTPHCPLHLTLNLGAHVFGAEK